MITDKVIERVIEQFTRPRLRLVCICGAFSPGVPDDGMAWTRCLNCGGWKSEEMLCEEDVLRDE